MVEAAWHFPWSSARAHLGKSYRIVDLADIGDYINPRSWKKYLMTGEDAQEIDYMRRSTFQGKVFGPLDIVEQMQERLKQKLLPRSRGRQKGWRKDE